MTQSRRMAAPALLALSLALAAGCGDPLPPPADPERARQALTAALDAWKAGGTPDALAGQSPPIRMIDRDWQDGRKLVSYELTGAGQELGLNLQVPTRLTLVDAKGKEVRKTLTYVVSPGEPPVITRLEADF